VWANSIYGNTESPFGLDKVFDVPIPDHVMVSQNDLDRMKNFRLGVEFEV